MMATVISNIKLPSSLVLRAYSLRLILTHEFSSQNRNSSDTGSNPPQETHDCSQVTDGNEHWLNIRAGIFGPDDVRLPLPGNIGLSNEIPIQLMKKFQEERIPRKHFGRPIQRSEEFKAKLFDLAIGKNSSNLPFPLDLDFYIHFLANLSTDILDSTEERKMSRISVINTMNHTINHYRSKDLEVTVQLCPKIMKKDFNLMFNRKIPEEKLTVINVCRKTKHDMSGWSEKVEEEREILLELFVNTAQRICANLSSCGFWADFVDPTSGRPFNTRFTTDSFCETDERYRYFGFHIEDLGCCKVISHSKWGTNIFVGSVVTNAPPEDPNLSPILSDLNLLVKKLNDC